MSEFEELEKRKGKFFSKCALVLAQARNMHAKLKPKLESLGNYETQNMEEKRLRKERDYLTYNHDFEWEKDFGREQQDRR